MKKIVEDLKTMGQVDQEARLNGRAIGMTISPLPQHQRKRKFHLFHGELLEEDDFDDDENEHDEEEHLDDAPDETSDESESVS